jgi:ketosteroid isomerase-like protein
MKYLSLIVLISLFNFPVLFAQDPKARTDDEKDINHLIGQYLLARESKDSILLKNIVTADVDQLVSSGEWRKGIDESIGGMMRSSANNPGERSIRVEKIRFIDSGTAIVDALYEIKNANGPARKMWSTFIVVYWDGMWKITAIRNMLPAG